MRHIKKAIAFIILTGMLLGMQATVFAASTLSGDGVFYTDFSDAGDLSAWKQERDDGTGKSWQEDNFKVADGFVTPEKGNLITGLLYKGKKYKNVLIESSLDKNARFQFRGNSESTWSDSRFYVEIDFAGSVIIRDAKDVELASTLVYNLVSRVQTEVKIKVYNNTVKVYLKGDTTPVLSYTDEKLKASEGYCSIMLVRQNPSIDYIRYTPLDQSGLYNGKDPVGDTNKDDGKNTSGGYNYGSSSSSKASSSTQSSSSSSSEAASSSSKAAESSIVSSSKTESELISSSSEVSSSAPEASQEKSFPWILIIIIGVVVIGVGTAVIFLLKKKKE